MKSRYNLIKKKPYKVRRITSGGGADRITGYPVEEKFDEFMIEGHQYPLDDYRKSLLPASIRSRGARRLHTEIECRLRSVEEYSQAQADRVQINGLWYEVQNVEDFDMGVLDHFEYLLVRIEVSAGERQ